MANQLLHILLYWRLVTICYRGTEAGTPSPGNDVAKTHLYGWRIQLFFLSGSQAVMVFDYETSYDSGKMLVKVSMANVPRINKVSEWGLRISSL